MIKLISAKSLIRSPFAASLLLRVVGASLAFLLGVVLARLLTASDLGKYGIVFSAMTLASIPFSNGFPNFLTQHLPTMRTRRGVVKSIRLTNKFALVLGGLYVVAGVLFARAEIGLAGWNLGWLAVLLLAPITGIDMIRGGAMRGLGSANLSQVPALIVRPVVAVTCLLVANRLAVPIDLGAAIVAYIAGCVVSLAVGQVLLHRAVRRKTLPIHGTLVSDRALPISVRGLLSSVGSFSVFGIAGTLTGTIDLLLLNYFGDFSGAGNYRVALQGIALVVLGHNAIGGVSYVQLAQSVGERKLDEIGAVSDRSLKWQLYSTLPIVIGVLAFGRPVIAKLFGEEYDNAYSILVILCVGHLVTIAVGTSSYLVLLASKQIVGAVVSLGGVLATLAVSLVLFPSLGVIGVAIGSSVGAVVRSIGYLLIVRRHFGIDAGIYGLIMRAREAHRFRSSDG